MSRSYYSLLTNEDGAGWAVQFGDYDREVVVAEQEDFCDGGIPRRLTKIVCTSDSQADIDAKVAELNREIAA